MINIIKILVLCNLISLFTVNANSFSKRSNIQLDSINLEIQDFKVPCFNFNKKGLFKNKEELEENYNSNRAYLPECNNASLPNINFDTKDLIWIRNAIGGCEKPKLEYKLIKIPKEKKYIFQL